MGSSTAPRVGTSCEIGVTRRRASLPLFREPACVPHLLTSLFGANAEDRLRQLVLDGIFEVEHAGGFVSGAAAFPFFGGRP